MVSVSMLTEGWDANTVTHILGVRAFRSQLLCEQVVGRGLRRRSLRRQRGRAASSPSTPRSTASRSSSSPRDKPIKDPLPPKPVDRGRARRGPRATCGSTFPKLDGYRVELPDEEIWLDLDDAPAFEIGPNTVPSWVEMRGVVGERELEEGDPTQLPRRRRSPSRSPSASCDASSTPATTGGPGCSRSWSRSCRDWLEQCVIVDRRLQPRLPDDDHRGAAPRPPRRSGTRSLRQVGNRRERLRPMLSRFDPEGSTADVDFPTRKAHRADREVRGLPRHARRQGRQHLGAAPRGELELNTERRSVREERPPRLHDPVRAQGPDALLRPGLPGPARRPATTTSTHADRRGLRQPEEPRADQGRRRPPPATRGASR